jgi:hypothetical protein
MAPAAEMLDIIPADCCGALAIRSLADLKKKGDKFLEESKMHVGLRPSELFEEGFRYLGLKVGVDEKAPAALMIVNPKVADGSTDLSSINTLFVVAIPFSDRDTLAGNFGFRKGELKADQVTKARKSTSGYDYCIVRGSHLYLAMSDKPLKHLSKAKTLGEDLSKERRKAFDRSDIVFLLGLKAWGKPWLGALDYFQRQMASRSADEKRAAADLHVALESIRYELFALTLDDGIAFRALTVFPEKMPEEATRILTALGAGKGTSSLRGLPTGKVIAAHAARNDGMVNSMMARLLLEMLLRNELETNKLLSPVDRPLVSGVFTEVWKRLKGRRLAVYQNEDEAKHGLFSTVMILDADDPKKLLDEIAALARFAVGKDLDLSDKTGKGDDIATVKKLIRDLGDDDYQTRESASTKLALIGEAALPLLEKAARSDDAEAARRADDLVADIKDRAATRRKELLDKTAARPIRPGFVLSPGAEKLGEQRIDIVNVKLGKEDATAVKQMRQMLGPDWHKIRLAVVGKQVVVLIGSDLDLLEQTLKNLRDGAPGLAAESMLARFTKQADPTRKVEVHFAVGAFDGLLDAAGPKLDRIKHSPSLSSVALSVEKDRAELNVYIPMDEVKVLVKSRGW